MTHLSRSQAGFTLLEILIALGIMAFGVATVIGLFAAATATQKRAMDHQQAALLAESVLADVESWLDQEFDLDAYPAAPPRPTSMGLPFGAALDDTGQPDPTTRMVVERQRSRQHPGAFYTVYLTPLEPPLNGPPLAFVAEVLVRWNAEGKAREELFQTILLRRMSLR